MNSRTMLLTTLLLGLALAATAQEPPRMRGRGGERVEEYKKIRMIDALKLDEETSVRFFARYNKHRDAMREQQEKVNTLITRLEEMRGKNAAAAEFEPVLKELQGVQEEMTAERTRYYNDLKGLLSTGQLVDYLVFERNFYKNLRETVRDMQRDRLGPRERN